MGWARGSDIFNDLIDAAKKYIPKENRREFYKKMINSFEDCDWDTQNECLGNDPIYDKLIKEMYGEDE